MDGWDGHNGAVTHRTVHAGSEKSRLSRLIFGAVVVQTGGISDTPEIQDTLFGWILA